MVSDERLGAIRRNLEGSRTARQRMDGLIPEPYNTALLTMAETHAADVGDLLAALAAAQAEVRALKAAAVPIMAYLTTLVSVADQQGHLKPGDVRSNKLANVNDVWLLRSDIERFRALLAPEPQGAEGQPAEGRAT